MQPVFRLVGFMGLSQLWAKFKADLNDNVFVQLGHGAGGYGITLTPCLWGATWIHILYGVILVLAWSVPKEYAFDIYVEKQTYADGWVDQRSYLIGSALAIAMFVICKFT